MYLIKLDTERTFEAAHNIPHHKGHCKHLHGHTYRVLLSISALHDKKKGIAIDFGDIKKIVDKFDHAYLNNYFKFPSAENLALYFALKIVHLDKKIIYSVSATVYETEDSCATFTYINPALK